MTTFDPSPNEHVSSVDVPAYREPFGALAAYIQRASSGERAALARLQPESLQPHQLAALARALLAAGLSSEQWHADTWPRWALIAHGMALAGHDGKQKLGQQLAQAGVFVIGAIAPKDAGRLGERGHVGHPGEQFRVFDVVGGVEIQAL